MANNARQEPILKLANIHKAFGGVQALAGVDFELYPGEIHALVGENGAGKSTMVKVITGVHQIDEGEILFRDEPVSIPNPQYAQRLGIAAIYQEATVFPDLDVAENIFMGHHPVRSVTRSITWRQMYEQAAQPLRDLGVDLDPRTKVRGLTVAQLQMVEIAKALSFNAQVLVMDEPTSALTLNEVADLFRIAKQLRDVGTAIIFISHRLDEVFELADRVTVLRDGHYVGTRDVSQVTHGELIHMMVGRTLDTLFPKMDVEQGETILRVEGLTRPGAFEDVGFELKQGEILGLAGLVGARRTDVARAIFGVEPAESGAIWVDGQQASIKRPKDALALGIAYVPEDHEERDVTDPAGICQRGLAERESRGRKGK
jgi:rhamnose transport system ATP-binding protein